MSTKAAIGVVLVVVGLVGILLAIPLYSFIFYGGGFWAETGQGRGIYTPRSDSSSRPSMSVEQAKYIADQYLNSLKDPDLAVKEIMEFEHNFYIIVNERSTGVGAFEVLIWEEAPHGGMGPGMVWGGVNGGSAVGQIVPEPGPNMMWNAKYGGMMGHMRGGMMGGMMGRQYGGVPTALMPINESEARQIGQRYLDEYLSGGIIEEATTFYGYYTFDFGKNGQIYGMFSVNGYTGQVWYHGWHGVFIGMEEYGEDHE